jgi:hypothetical protein
LLRFIGNRDHPTGLAFASSRERHPDTWPMLIAPRGFDQQPADQDISGPRDPTAPMLLATGVLPWHQADIGHQRPRRLEPPKVMQVGEDQEGRQGVDSTEAPQPTHRFAIGVSRRDLRQPGVELNQARL